MGTVVGIYSNLMLLIPFLVGFYFVIKTGRLFWGTFITWILSITCTFFVVVISPAIAFFLNRGLPAYFPHTLILLFIVFLGWIPSFLACFLAEVLRLITYRYIKRTSGHKSNMSIKPLFVSALVFSLLYFSCVFLLATCTPSTEKYDEKNEQTTKREFEFALCYEFETDEATDFILRIKLPKSISKRQKITGIEYSQKPYWFSSKNGNDYVDFYYKSPPKTFDIKVNIKGEIYGYDLSVASRDQNDLLTTPADIYEYLKPERMIEANDPEIRKAAAKLEGDSRVKTVENIYDFVIDHMEPDISREKSAGALQALKTGKGKCQDYCDFFVALCRARDIPARSINGYILDYVIDPKHAWIEVYFHNMGWVPFDPILGEQESSPSNERWFFDLPTNYVYFTHIRNDEKLNNSSIHYIGRRYGHVDFKFSIEFKKPYSQIYIRSN